MEKVFENEAKVNVVGVKEIIEAMEKNKEAGEYLKIKNDTNFEFYGNGEQKVKMFASLAQFQAEVQNPANNKVNPFHKSKYADLGEVLTKIRPVAGKYGLAVIQIPITDSAKGTVEVQTVLTHKDGGMINFSILSGKPEGGKLQNIGAALTYLRRYSVSCICGIASEEDDDGNSASGINTQKSQVDNKLKEKIDEIDKLCNSFEKEKLEKAKEIVKKHNDGKTNYKQIKAQKVCDAIIKELKEIK